MKTYSYARNEIDGHTLGKRVKFNNIDINETALVIFCSYWTIDIGGQRLMAVAVHVHVAERRDECERCLTEVDVLAKSSRYRWVCE